MRILQVTDIHAQEGQLRWLVRESGNFGLVVITGDLLDLNAHRPLADQLDRVTSYLSQIKTPMALCSGNHDSFTDAGPRFEHASWMQDLRRKNVWVDGDKFTLGGRSFRCVPWRGQLETPGADEIWLIHSPPDESPTGITRGGAGFGDFAFGDLCRAGRGPQLALSGHVHDPLSWRAKVGRTWSLNPGCVDCGAGLNSIEIDLARGVAFFRPISGEPDATRLWSAAHG